MTDAGGNVIGVAVLNTEIVVKRVELLLEAVPGISEIGYLVRADNPGTVQAWEVAKAAATLGVKRRRFDVNPFQPADLDRAIATVANQRLGAMLVPADQSFYDQRRLLGARATKHRLPWVTAYPASVEAGALLSTARTTAMYGTAWSASSTRSSKAPNRPISRLPSLSWP